MYKIIKKLKNIIKVFTIDEYLTIFLFTVDSLYMTFLMCEVKSQILMAVKPVL